MTIFELTEAEIKLLNMLVDGDMTDEEQEMWNDAKEFTDEEYAKKFDSYGCVIQEATYKVNNLLAESKRMADKAEVLKNNIERLKKRLEESMRATGRRSVDGEHFRFVIQKNGGKQKLVLDEEPIYMPEAFQKWEVKVDTEALREYLETHPDCPFAHLEERGESFRIK